MASGDFSLFNSVMSDPRAPRELNKQSIEELDESSINHMKPLWSTHDHRRESRTQQVYPDNSGLRLFGSSRDSSTEQGMALSSKELTTILGKSQNLSYRRKELQDTTLESRVSYGSSSGVENELLYLRHGSKLAEEPFMSRKPSQQDQCEHLVEVVHIVFVCERMRAVLLENAPRIQILKNTLGSCFSAAIISAPAS